jgi:hypothetical protein
MEGLLTLSDDLAAAVEHAARSVVVSNSCRSTCELGDVNSADRADFAPHRGPDTSLMKLVSAWAPADRTSRTEAAPTLTAADGVLHAQRVDRDAAEERYDNTDDRYHARTLSPRSVQRIWMKVPFSG